MGSRSDGLARVATVNNYYLGKYEPPENQRGFGSESDENEEKMP